MNHCEKCRKEFQGKMIIHRYCSFRCAPLYERHRWMLIFLTVPHFLYLCTRLDDFHPAWWTLTVPYLYFIHWIRRAWWKTATAFPHD